LPIATKLLRYDHDGVSFEAYAAWDDANPAPRPVVLIAGTLMGRTDFEEGKARKLAELGYVGIAIDYFGLGNWPSSIDEGRAAMDALNADRPLLRDRMRAALAASRELGPSADPERMAAMGFCFGGKCVLDLARSGADIAGVVSFHGLYDKPDFPNEPIKAKILILHGWNDPLDPPETVLTLATELTDEGVDWQIHSYGHTVHGFTNPVREGMYNPDSDRRSWQAMRNFLEEIFGP